MTKHALAVRTRAQVRADASLLDGSHAQLQLALEEAPETEPSEDGTVGELWLYGVVGGYWFGFDAESVAHALRDLDVDTLHVRIHSPGGYAPDGIAIANLLRNHRSRIVVVVDGYAASAASVIAIAGDEIVMGPGAQLMIHDCMTWGYGNEAEMASAAAWIGGQSRNYAGLYAYKGGGTAEQWREKMRADNGRGTWYTGEEAIAAGLADRIGTVQATSSPPVAPVEQLDDEDYLAKAAHDVALLEQCVHPAARAAWTGEKRTHKPPSASAVGSPTPTETESAVAFSDEQMKNMRAKLGLSEDADEATIAAALDEALEERADAPPTSNTASVPEGMQLVETAVLEGMRSDAAAGRSARDELDNQARDREINAAISSGKTTPARRAHWEAAWKADPEGAKAQLAALAPGLVPVEEAGHAEDSEGEGPKSLADIRNDEGYSSWKVS